jgi:hypothetical protein
LTEKREKFFIAVFEYIGQFYLQNDDFKVQKVLSELEIKVFLENGLGSSYFTDLRQSRFFYPKVI